VGYAHLKILAGNPSTPCPDCPASRQGLLEDLVPCEEHGCSFQCIALPARAQLPARWFERYGLAFVRRGVVVRQRADAQGRVTSFDAAGPGCLYPMRMPSENTASSVPCGYAATDSLLCLWTRDQITPAVTADANVATDLIELQNATMERITRIADARGRTSIEARVAALLVALSDTLSPPRRRDLLPSGLQLRDLGSLLGIRHETVCRALGTLTKQGAVERTPDGLRILDREFVEGL